jgi:pyruvate/2-oxoglutarate dehydrogenase complex dihydrolipoamide dehydrogenase (E3) component
MFGRVPSKFLIHRARVAHVTRTASRFSVHAGEPKVDLRAIVEEKRATVDGHRAVSWQGALSAPGLELLEGEARFVSHGQVQVGPRILAADQIFIATGMRPLIPQVPGLADGPYLTNESVMELSSVPNHLIVVGGGYIGCELGAGVPPVRIPRTIVQHGDRLIGEEDQDASTVLGRAFAE